MAEKQASINEMLTQFKHEINKHRDISLIKKLGSYAIICVYWSDSFSIIERQYIYKQIFRIINDAENHIRRLKDNEQYLKQISLKPYAPNFYRKAV